MIFGICDSCERVPEGIHFGSTCELACHDDRDPRYVPLIRRMIVQDCVFGVENLPDETPALVPAACSDNIGIAMLRSRAPGRKDTAQIQAVLRYGSHGFAHGHFDRMGLLSLLRYGRSFFNPQCVWWGYPHCMYKFHVQNAMTRNMAVVDEKHQNVADSRLTLFARGRRVQAACVENEVTWSYPSCGGMVCDEHAALEARCRFTGCTEPIMTRRLMAVAEDCIVLFDALQGDREQRFSSLFQIKGFRGLEGDARETGHTRRFTDDPLSGGQSITDCRPFDAIGPACARFRAVFGEGEDLRGTRSEHNEPGILSMAVHTAWPAQTHQLGLVAEDHHMDIPVDGRTLARGTSGHGWAARRSSTATCPARTPCACA